MNWVLVLLGIVIIFNIGLIFFLLRRKDIESDNKSDGMYLLQKQMESLNRAVNDNIKEIIRGVTRVDETGKQMVGYAEQIENLQNMLKNPKQRGVLGEYFLETVLNNVLPPESFELQYSFPNGTIVDAVVFVKDKIIPIDSKFSLENYNRMAEEKDPIEHARLEKLFVADLKDRIAETSKYIQPEQGTMDFAFMFIPHEAIYYDLIVNKIGAIQEETESLIQRAASKQKVIIVSPTSFLAYLQTVLQGLKALHIEEQAQEIKKNVENLVRHLSTYNEHHSKLGNSLSTVINHYNNSTKEFGKIDKDVLRITGNNVGVEMLTLDKPSVE